jgi:two-component system sensor histidine kinase BaeS
MIEGALILAGATLMVGIGAAYCLRLLPALRLQLTGLALVAVVLPLVAVLASGLVMLHSRDDAEILALLSGAALSAVVGALLLGRWVLNPLRQLQRTADELAAGDLGARAAEEGPSELGELGEAFNKMAQSIERLFEARRQLVAWASHDLRTPLSSMQAMLEALQDELARPEEYLPAIRDQVRILSAMVDDLFELTRIDAGVLTLELRETRLDRLLESCVRALEANANARGIRLERRWDAHLPAVQCAPEKVERIVHNLLTNALRHTPSDGAVAVVASTQEHSVTVAVEDNGVGLTGETKRRMFEHFWRADPSRTADGAGLGLAIAQGLVEAQGGRIWAENRPGGGARVAFTLQPARLRSLAEVAAD